MIMPTPSPGRLQQQGWNNLAPRAFASIHPKGFVVGIAWGKCVIIDLPDLDGVQIVWHPAYAAHLLIDSWPVDHGRAYGAAINACADAVVGTRTGEHARIAFIAAINEAEVEMLA